MPTSGRGSKPKSKSTAVAALSLVAICGTVSLFHAPSIGRSHRASSSSVVASNATAERRRPDPRRRRLSRALPNGGCAVTAAVTPRPGTPVTYAASYPGCGARMSWNLVEALTGLETGDDWNNNGRGESVVTVKTHYPQSNGILVDFDDRIKRAFVIIRNPVESIPSFFNHIYEMQNHLSVHSARAPVTEWVKWRNAHLEKEIAEYKKFICYWMDRYPPEHRYLMTYEGLTDDQVGPEVAKGLNDFLALAQGVTPIATESVPCIWRAVVKNQLPPAQAARIQRLQAAAQGQRFAPVMVPRPASRHRRRLNPGHYDSQRKGAAVPRPYTAAQLDGMMTMLAEVAERYKDTDARLYYIMMGYHEKIQARKKWEFENEGGQT